MMSWAMMEIYVEVLEELRRSRPPLPEAPGPGLWAGLRQRVARGLVALGVLLDAEASRAAAGSLDAAPRLNGRHA